MSEIAAVILAAGRGTRFGAGPGTSKVLALLQGKPLLWWVAGAARASRVTETVVVTGHAAEAVGEAVAALGVLLVHNPTYADGLASSLQAGIAALNPSTEAAVILLADMPRISAGIIDSLIAGFEATPGRAAVVPVYQGRRGNPVLIARGLFSAIAGLRGDEGARRLLRDNDRMIVQCRIADDAINLDIDRPDDLAALRAFSESLPS